MSHQRILVTGSTGGIGRFVCRELVKNNYELVLTARNEDRLAELESELRELGSSNTTSLPSDFSDKATLIDLATKISDGLDGMVLMPPQPHPTDNPLPDPDTWQHLFSESFIGPLSLIKAVLPALEKRSPSKVVILSGISSAQVLGNYATSNVIRTAWLAEAKTLAHAYGSKGVHFNTLSLGGVLTERYLEKIHHKASKNGITFHQQMAQETSNVPLRKYAKPEDVARAVVGLLGPFSDHITGLNVICDGGFTRSY